MDATSPPIADKIDDLIATVERATPDASADPGIPAHTHPLLPGYAFPAPAALLDARDATRDPRRLEEAAARAHRKGQCTVILDAARRPMAVVAPASAYEA